MFMHAAVQYFHIIYTFVYLLKYVHCSVPNSAKESGWILYITYMCKIMYVIIQIYKEIIDCGNIPLMKPVWEVELSES